MLDESCWLISSRIAPNPNEDHTTGRANYLFADSVSSIEAIKVKQWVDKGIDLQNPEKIRNEVLSESSFSNLSLLIRGVTNCASN